ncbi:hypothetical protein [Caulobacter sp. 17J65-9]|uniref:hypothetical protein n=1 Tax=Caulobacter sp. 17J65-9 TaxID=2709382 RepID=UPI0013C754A0|nr:hypothetical protein [Caulobacter sp. 17J65-9]NEX92417.1 hypothetical protein [Caulobacter sp. 17J65-9]
MRVQLACFATVLSLLASPTLAQEATGGGVKKTTETTEFGKYTKLNATVKMDGPLEDWYAYPQLTYTPPSKIGLEESSKWERYLKAIFIKDSRAVALTLDISLKRENGTVTPLNTIVLYSVTMADRPVAGSPKVEAKNEVWYQNQAAPLVSLNDNDVLLVTPKIRYSKKSQSEVLAAIGRATKAAAALGGHGWLVSLVTDAERSAKFNEIQSELDSVFDSSYALDTKFYINLQRKTYGLAYNFNDLQRGISFGNLEISPHFTCTRLIDVPDGGTCDWTKIDANSALKRKISADGLTIEAAIKQKIAFGFPDLSADQADLKLRASLCELG